MAIAPTLTAPEITGSVLTVPANGAPACAPDAVPDPLTRIAAFTAQASFEVTRLAPGDIEALQSFPSRPRVYIGAVPARPAQAKVEVACALAAAGFEPVPHIAVRSFASNKA